MCARSIPHPLLQYEGAEVCLIVKDFKGAPHPSPQATFAFTWQDALYSPATTLCHGWQAIWDANLWDHPDSFCYAPFFFSLVGTMLLELLLQLVVKLEIDGLRVRVLGDIFNPTSGDSDK